MAPTRTPGPEIPMPVFVSGRYVKRNIPLQSMMTSSMTNQDSRPDSVRVNNLDGLQGRTCYCNLKSMSQPSPIFLIVIRLRVYLIQKETTSSDWYTVSASDHCAIEQGTQFGAPVSVANLDDPLLYCGRVIAVKNDPNARHNGYLSGPSEAFCVLGQPGPSHWSWVQCCPS
ncbi:uncharacterized protein MELLADRAFT_61564 [Melampsora larici-populina 98AG31]|uniref:Uncharacterized protein n=1 Tax=Melampsora larici-populina (strain 98AG31 / pathotype 3-4-7) TaxID=747676 RepID=F4RFF1_MELLP|nr:uncharacterized protein MELLADRAFT_61564 [Melampsora larici-populina 98AG31]EGG08798.1 hypothetical protein MELLADRAFT_61564 [Melampsora larici-populina 98AG31]